MVASTREEMIAEAKRLRAAGLTYGGITARLGGPSRLAVWRWLNGGRAAPTGGKRGKADGGLPMA